MTNEVEGLVLYGYRPFTVKKKREEDAIMMLAQSYRKNHTRECLHGYRCCTTDDRNGKQIRRTARRVEKREWLSEEW